VDTTIIAGLVGAIATLVAAVLPVVINRIRRDKGVLRGTIDQLLVPLTKSHATQTFRDMLPKAKEVRMCGWALFRTIDENRHKLRELTQRGCDLRILLLDPASSAVNSLDNVITDTDPLERKTRNWPSVTPKGIIKSNVLRTIEILKDNDIVGGGKKTVHLCDSLLPFGILMVECEDGSGWLSVQIYPLHPDVRLDRRFAFTLGNNKTELWRLLKEQFDVAWEDPSFSHPI